MIKNHGQKLIGSFEFILIKQSQPDLDYCLPQSIIASIFQGNQEILSKKLENITEHPQSYKIEFEYLNTIDQIELVLMSAIDDHQFNSDNTVEIRELIIDDLFPSNRLLHNMILSYDGKFEESNVLYRTAKLSIKLNLPMVSNMRIIL